MFGGSDPLSGIMGGNDGQFQQAQQALQTYQENLQNASNQYQASLNDIFNPQANQMSGCPSDSQQPPLC